MNAKRAIGYFLLLILSLPLQGTELNKLPIKGSFIQPYLVADWDDERWQEEFKNLQEAGMDLLIFMHTVHTSKEGKTTAVYPSAIEGVESQSEDLLENCLRNARQAGFKIFVGLNFDDRWWDLSFTPEWIYDQMLLGNTVAEELIQRYKKRYPETMYGWYWVWEVEHSHCSTQPYMEGLVQALNINLDYLHLHAEDMPVLLSPFMNQTTSTPEECARVWGYVLSNAHFKDGDIFAPQDCVGAGWLTIEVVEEWFKALAEVIPTTPKIEFWGNVELFDQRFWTVAPVGRLKRQVELLTPYVSNFISFAYSHYYSPSLKNPLVHHTYVHYMKKGVLPACDSPLPVSGLTLNTVSKEEAYLEWNAVEQKNDLMGYWIYKDGALIGDIQYDHTQVCKTTWNTQGKSGVYEVASYTVCGKESERSSLTVLE